MESQAVVVSMFEDEQTDPTDQAARGVGRAIAFEVGYSHTVDEPALNTARGYATMAGDSLGKDVRSCLRYGNAAAAAFDSMIFEFAIVAIVTTFRCWVGLDRPRMELVGAAATPRLDRRKRTRQTRWTPRTDRRVWKGQVS